MEEKPGTTNPQKIETQDKCDQKPVINTQEPTSLWLKPTNTKKTQPSLLKKTKKVDGENQSSKNSKIINLKEFLARKKLERESKMSKLIQKSSFPNADVVVSYPNTATTRNSADTFHNQKYVGQRAAYQTPNQTTGMWQGNQSRNSG